MRILLIVIGLAAVLYGSIEMVNYHPVSRIIQSRPATKNPTVDAVLAQNDRVLAHVDEVERASHFSEGRHWRCLAVSSWYGLMDYGGRKSSEAECQGDVTNASVCSSF